VKKLEMLGKARGWNVTTEPPTGEMLREVNASLHECVAICMDKDGQEVERLWELYPDPAFLTLALYIMANSAVVACQTLFTYQQVGDDLELADRLLADKNLQDLAQSWFAGFLIERAAQINAMHIQMEAED
jgi:hypothetical protein